MVYHLSSSLYLFLHIILLLLHNNGCSACFQPERDALLELRASFSSNGGLYSNALVDWIDGKNPDCCVWSGVECDNVTHRVTQLGLSNLSGLRQLLNASLFLPFQHLRSLDLSINPITGWVTNEGLERFSKLSNLEQLHLGYTALNARSLESVNLVTSLKELYLDHNLIEEFPKVAYNKLFGPIPNKAQFITFDETSYQGNPSLCGPPLQSTCINNDKNYDMDEGIKSTPLWSKYGIDSISFVVSFVVAYIMYLAIFVVVLYINPYCRRLWFHLIDRCINFVFTLFGKDFKEIENLHMTCCI